VWVNCFNKPVANLLEEYQVGRAERKKKLLSNVVNLSVSGIKVLRYFQELLDLLKNCSSGVAIRIQWLAHKQWYLL